MIDSYDLADMEQQLLVAAAVLGLGPSAEISRANTVRVVNQVLRWRGLTDEQIRAGWREAIATRNTRRSTRRWCI